MATVSFKRSPNINNIPIVDGQLIFDELDNKIYMDNGTQRLQYGGDVSLISNIDYATNNNAFSALATKNLFVRKTSVVDDKDDALAATEHYIPLGCLAFQSAIGTSDYSGIGNTISDALVTLNNDISTLDDQLTANNTSIYMDYKNGVYGYNTSSSRGADTFHPFNRGAILISTFQGQYANTPVQIDVRTLLENIGVNYSNCTAGNFLIMPTSIYINGKTGGGWYDGTGTPTIQYSSSTGTLTLSGVYYSTPSDIGTQNYIMSGNVYYVSSITA